MAQDLSAIKGFLKNVFSNTREIFAPRSSQNEPMRLLAKVLKVDESNIILWSDKGRLTGKIETPVFRGEYLMLEFSGVKEGKLHYRILARSGISQDTADVGNTAEIRQPSLWSFLVNPGFDFPDYPVLVRYNYYNKEDETMTASPNNMEEQKRSVLELIVETRNLGLVMIRLQLLNERVHCSFLVEEESAGRALEEEALRSMGDNISGEDVSEKLIEWKVHPVRDELLRSAPKGSFALNQKV